MMKKPTPSLATRREFLRRSSAMAVTGAAAPWAMNLAAIGEAAAQSASDYKALVCVFLYGGCDYGNTLIPTDAATHSLYMQHRRGLGISLDALTTAGTTLTPATALAGGRSYALGPGLKSLLPLWQDGRMAALLNIGTLAYPTSKLEYTNGSVPLPPKLFSHNDQQSVWQTSGSSEGATTGWGGRIGELLADTANTSNRNASFTAVSVSGNAVYLAGPNQQPYQVSSGGSIQINGLQSLYGSTAAGNALRSLITDQSSASSWLARSHASVVKSSIDSDIKLRQALATAAAPAVVFPATKLGSQLSMVARMIAAREALGMKRQVFFVSMGGWDHHNSLLTLHQPMLTEVADALAAFHQATSLMGVNQQVTSFTASDFGRTLAGNGNGSDHGWGGFHFVQGGAVSGRRFVGKPPMPGDNGPDDVGKGRMLPSLAVDQFAAELARWMGVPEGRVADVVPAVGRFDRISLFR